MTFSCRQAGGWADAEISRVVAIMPAMDAADFGQGSILLVA